MTTRISPAAIVSAVAGTCLLLDVAVIALVDGPFGVADEVLFFAGFLAALVSIGFAARALTAGSSHRMLFAVVAFVGLLVGLLALSLGVQALLGLGHVGGSHAVADEWGIVVLGLAMLCLTLWFLNRPPVPQRQ